MGSVTRRRYRRGKVGRGNPCRNLISSIRTFIPFQPSWNKCAQCWSLTDHPLKPLPPPVEFERSPRRFKFNIWLRTDVTTVNAIYSVSRLNDRFRALSIYEILIHLITEPVLAYLHICSSGDSNVADATMKQHLQRSSTAVPFHPFPRAGSNKPGDFGAS